MRITYVTETYPPEVNGVSLTVERTVRFLRERGHEVDLIRPTQPGESGGAWPGEWRTAGCAIPMYREMRFGFAHPSTLAKRFAETRAELVHVATPGPLGWAAVSAARQMQLPTSSDFRTNFHEYSRYYRLGFLAPATMGYLRAFHNRTRRTFVPTHQTRRELQESGFERMEVVGRGVDLDRFSPHRRNARLRARFSPEGGPILLYVGRLAAEKNVRLALKAFQCTRALLRTARMIVVGDGPKRKALEREFPEASFVGMQTGDALAAYYASADLFLFPSLSDTFGNVTLEALASGLPVVAFDVAAASEHVLDQVSGRLLAPGDDQSFITAACLLATLHRELLPMRQAARRAATLATWPRVLEGFERLLIDTVEDRGRTAAQPTSWTHGWSSPALPFGRQARPSDSSENATAKYTQG
jgi:glycosyltransferase involved in cell wall biosynthesis